MPGFGGPSSPLSNQGTLKFAQFQYVSSTAVVVYPDAYALTEYQPPRKNYAVRADNDAPFVPVAVSTAVYPDSYQVTDSRPRVQQWARREAEQGPVRIVFAFPDSYLPDSIPPIVMDRKMVPYLSVEVISTAAAVPNINLWIPGETPPTTLASDVVAI